MPSFVEILGDPSALWTRCLPADETAISHLVGQCDFKLPEEYLEFLRYSNGGEGPMCIEPWWFQIWSTEVVVEHNRGYNLVEFLPGWFAVGSNGGGEMLAIRKRAVSPCPIYMVPFIPMAESDAIEVCHDFEMFAMALGRNAT